MAPRIPLLVLAVLSLTPHLLAQTADEVIEQYLAAIGGRPALQKLETRIATASVALFDWRGSFLWVTKRPNKSRTHLEMNVGAGNRVQLAPLFFGPSYSAQYREGTYYHDLLCNGTAAFSWDNATPGRQELSHREWQELVDLYSSSADFPKDRQQLLYDVHVGRQQLTGSELHNLLNDTFPTPFLNYKEAGAKAELVGTQKVGRRDAHVVKYTPALGPSTWFYFDAKNYLLLRVLHRAQLANSQTETNTAPLDLSNYRTVDAIKVPFKLEARPFAVEFRKVEFNKPLVDTMFEPTDFEMSDRFLSFMTSSRKDRAYIQKLREAFFSADEEDWPLTSVTAAVDIIKILETRGCKWVYEEKNKFSLMGTLDLALKAGTLGQEEQDIIRGAAGFTRGARFSVEGLKALSRVRELFRGIHSGSRLGLPIGATVEAKAVADYFSASQR